MTTILEAVGILYSDFKGGRVTKEPTTEAEYEALEWVTGIDELDSCIYGTRPSGTPTWAEAKAKCDELIADYNSKEYQRKRKEEYPDWGTQLDYIYHNGIDKWKADIVDPVKNKYPKP